MSPPVTRIQSDEVQPRSADVVVIGGGIAGISAAYHLGNRHVALQIGAGWLRYQHDYVLDDMVRGLGLSVEAEQAPFEPEAGAYGSHSHDHGAQHAIIRGVARD